MVKKTNKILAAILIVLGIIMLFPIYILFMVSFRKNCFCRITDHIISFFWQYKISDNTGFSCCNR